MRTRLYEIVSRPKRGDNVSRLYDMFIVLVALLSIAPALFHANSLHKEAQDLLAIIDTTTVYILCFDYLLNWMVCDIEQGKRGKWTEFLKYPFRFTSIVNLLSILPTLNLLPSGFLFLRALRIVRLFRYSKQLTVIVNVFIQERKTLGSVLLLALAYIFATALIMFTFEPGTFANFLDAVYWATITLTTIGFGDITPTSNLGHILTTVTSIFGIFIFALPAGIMTGGFLKQLHDKEEEGESYYSGGFFEGLKSVSFPFTPKKIKAYFKRNPKVSLYLRFIIAGIALNFFLCLFFSELWQPLWLDSTGTALIACALDPAAALIVSFVDNLIIAIYQQSPQNILYFSESALVALIYGYMLKQAKNGKVPFKKAPLALVIIILGQTAISFAITFLLWNGNFTTPFQENYRTFFMENGVPYYTASFLGLLVDRVFDAVSVFIIVNLILKGLSVRGFVARAWLEKRCPDNGAELLTQDEEKKVLLNQEFVVNTGILSCAKETVCLSREGLCSISAAMRQQAKKMEDENKKQMYLSCAETIYLLCRSNVKNEEEFERLFVERMKKFQ